MKIILAIALLATVVSLCGAVPVRMCINCDDAVEAVYIGGVQMLPLGPNSRSWNTFDCYDIDLPPGPNTVAWVGNNIDAEETGCMAVFYRPDGSSGNGVVLTAANHQNVKVIANDTGAVPDNWYTPSFDASSWPMSTDCALPSWDPHVAGAELVWLGPCKPVPAGPAFRYFRFAVTVASGGCDTPHSVFALSSGCNPVDLQFTSNTGGVSIRSFASAKCYSPCATPTHKICADTACANVCEVVTPAAPVVLCDGNCPATALTAAIVVSVI